MDFVPLCQNGAPFISTMLENIGILTDKTFLDELRLVHMMQTEQEIQKEENLKEI